MSILKNLIGEKLYEKQKEVLRDLQESMTSKGKHVINQIKEDSYIVQKKVLRQAQKELEESLKLQYSLKLDEFFNEIVKALEAKGFFGKLAAKLLKSYKQDILSAMGAK